MIDGLKPYTDYQESGAHWLGQVPKHWSVMPNRAIFEEVKDRDHPKEEMLSVTITRGIVRQRALLADTSKKDSSNQNKSAYKLVQPNDIAYNKMRAWQGAIGVSDLRGIISPAYVVMRLRSSQVPRYLHYLYRTPQFAKEAERWSYGITSDMWSLRPEHFKMIYAALPPRDEQAAIVKFLDYANGKIERAIRAKRKLIGLLNEQKQAIIHHAVTRGLDPTVKLKPSGIPWLGDVPEHWEVTNLGRLTLSFKTGPFGSILHQSDYVIGGIPLINPVHMSDGRINQNPNCTVDRATFNRLREYSLREGDLVFSRRGELGRCALAREEANGWLIGTGSIRVRLRETKINKEYLIAALRGRWVADYLSLSSIGATMQSLNTGILKRLPLPLPPPEEQTQIPRVIERDTAVIIAAIAHSEREIELLREYRTTLTAEVVTGKLDVREAVKRLPTETEEPLPLDDLVDDEIHAEAEA